MLDSLFGRTFTHSKIKVDRFFAAEIVFQVSMTLTKSYSSSSSNLGCMTSTASGRLPLIIPIFCFRAISRAVVFLPLMYLIFSWTSLSSFQSTGMLFFPKPPSRFSTSRAIIFCISLTFSWTTYRVFCPLRFPFFF